MNLFLIGYRGTGKTTVAKLVADVFSWRAIDADQVLQERAGKTISQMFADEGEPAFRDLEEKIVAELAEGDCCVISLGGGAVMRPTTRRVISQRGRVVWLKAGPSTIYFRLANDGKTTDQRPNLTAGGGLREIEELLTQREPIYRQSADFQVDTEEKTPAEAAECIVQWMREQAGEKGRGGEGEKSM